ncbi:MAG: 2-oxoacid:acceptor oxidoreductase family protein [Dehalococcoidia bacterium]
MRENLTVGMVGAGGDGVVVLGVFLQKLAAGQGYFGQMSRFYGAQIRGGGSAVKLGMNAVALSLPQDSVDILVCFDGEKYLEFGHELLIADDTLVLYDGEPPPGIDLPEASIRFDFTGKSREAVGAAQSKNIVALGLLRAILGLDRDRVREAIERDEELGLVKGGLPAYDAGERLFSGTRFPDLGLSPARDGSAKVILHGNSAMARAAIRAGCRAFFGYPITPASEIMQEMQEELSHGKAVFLQAEDEISSVALALGASLTGAKTMTATSGPGLDLMTESLVLASAAEIPMVIIDVQRGGPSTGIPSKLEQSDLNHAIYGGHGDAPRVVVAPYDVEGCYRLVIEGFNIAQYYQVPVILLSDQWLGQTFVAIKNDFLKQEYPLLERKKPAAEDGGDYKRYLFTEDSISPMADVGDEGFVHQITGLAHNEKGAPAFDFDTHQRMHEKRWRKLLPLCERDDLVRVFGNESAGRGIITWGSSAQIVLETLKDLGLLGKVKVCVPELIHPLPKGVEGFVKSIEQLLVVEMNYSGQFYRYLRSQLDLPKDTGVYARAGGRPFSRGELAAVLKEAAG